MSKEALLLWPKIIEVLDFWKGLPKFKQPDRGRPGKNKSYKFLLSQMNDPFVTVKRRFFEEPTEKLKDFLDTFQTSSPIALVILLIHWKIYFVALIKGLSCYPLFESHQSSRNF